MRKIEKVTLSALKKADRIEVRCDDSGKGTLTAVKLPDTKFPFEAKSDIEIPVDGIPAGMKFFFSVNDSKTDRQFKNVLSAIHSGDKIRLEVVPNELETSDSKEAGLVVDSLYVKMTRTFGKQATESTSEVLWTVQTGKVGFCTKK
jgi:hypothetical protein